MRKTYMNKNFKIKSSIRLYNVFYQIFYTFAYLYSFTIYVCIVNLIYLKNKNELLLIIHLVPAFCIITLLSILLGQHKKYAYYTVYLICILFGTIHTGHAILYGNEFNAESATAFIVTNIDESIEYIKSFFNYKIISILSLYISIHYILTKKLILKSDKYKMDGRDKIIAFLIISLLYIPFSALRNFRTPFDPYFPTKIIKKFLTAEKEMRFAKKLKKGYNYPAKSTYPSPLTIVLIIGESATRKNMHLYGYPRQTTPEMERIQNLYVFNDVISSAPTTQKSIGMMLTMADLKNTDIDLLSLLTFCLRIMRNYQK